jgi:hypothetical protein
MADRVIPKGGAIVDINLDSFGTLPVHVALVDFSLLARVVLSQHLRIAIGSNHLGSSCKSTVMRLQDRVRDL